MGASTALVCLGAALSACGSGTDGGYVAAGGPQGSGRAVAPSGDVSLAPLAGDGPSGSRDGGRQGGRDSRGDTGRDDAGPGDGRAPPGGSSGPSGSPSGAEDAGTGRGAGRDAPSAPSPGGGNSGPANGGSGHASATPAPPAPSAPAPAALVVGAPRREAADRRWCEKVTLSFRNTGGTAVRSGTVTLGTHIIGALGIDWATIGSVWALPAPIGPGAGTEKSWTVCVEAWRVPLGMHVETRDVSVQWK